MKIGIEVQRLFRRRKFGIETSALQLIRKLQELNPKCQFVVYAKNDSDRDCLGERDNLVVRTISGKLFVDFEQFFLPLAARHDRVDLLHCTGNTRPLFCNVPIVQTLHDVIFMDPISSKDSIYQQCGNYYRRFMVPFVTKKSDAVITVSEYEKQRILKRLKIDERKIRVIYNGIDQKKFAVIDNPASLQSVRVKYRLPEAFMLFLGNTSARKNAPGVVRGYAAYAATTEQPLPLVTPGLTLQFIRGVLRDHKVPARMEKHFIATGYIPENDLPALYNLSTLFLFPSFSEGFGMPVIEAMACGTPVITSNVSSLPEIAGNAALLVDPGNVHAIGNAIAALLSNEELRIEKIRSGLENAARFSWSRAAEEVFEVYERVCFRTQAVPARISYELQ